MSRADSRIVLASAGTGKTFQLTGRLLELYANGSPPRKVLASTFTRKAAGEILDRLITRLCHASGSEAAASKLSGELRGTLLGAARARELLCRLLRAIDGLEVATLDAWFLARVQSASLELGLSEAWELSDEQRERRLHARALSRALDRPRTDAEWTTLIADLRRGGADSRVHASLLATLTSAAGLARESDAAAWDFPPLPPPVPRADIALALACLDGVAAPLTKQGKPNATFQKALEKLRKLVRARRWLEFHETTLVANVLAGVELFSKLPIADELAAALRTLAREAACDLALGLRAQNRALRMLAEDFVDELDRARSEDQSLPFDALPRLLERNAAGAGVEHLLLDEFQDTSSVQWRALASSVHAVLEAPAGSFFCVGDSKQSIYGWRGAESRLLLGLPERFQLAAQELDLNFRSSRAVLDAVNRVFASLAANPALDAAARTAAARFQAAFHAQQASDQEKPGLVRLSRTVLEDDKAAAAERDRARIERGVEIALEIRKEHPDWRIAFLLRRNKLVPRLLEQLKSAGIDASGHGGNPLTDSAAVNAALSLFEFADHPGDLFAHFHAATSPLGAAAGLAFPSDERARVECAARWRERWLADGPAAILSGLAAAVRAGYGEFDQRRFAQLIALCLRLEASAGLRPAEFAARLAAERVPDPASAAVQVMTVHGAKGLEFEAVILLDLDSALDKHAPTVIAQRRRGDPAELYDVVTHTLPRNAAASLPALDEVQSGARATRLEEEFCVLYVSMTRAIHRLELIVDPPAEPKASFAGILVAALCPQGVPESPVLWELAHGSGVPAMVKPATAVLPGPELPAVLQLALSAPAIVHVAPSRMKAAGEFPAGADLEPLPAATSDLFRDTQAVRSRGALWHAWLERIEWQEQGLPALEELLASAGDTGESARAEARAFLAALAQPAVCAELSRRQAAERLGAPADELELLREQRFALLRDTDGARELVEGALDRAVIAKGRAEIVDFKTSAFAAGAPGEKELAERARGYAPQMRAYRDALVRLRGLDPARISLRICFIALGRTVVLEAQTSRFSPILS